MSRLIDNFLAFSRMERNGDTFAFAELDVETIVTAAVDAVRERFKASGSRLDVEVAAGLPAITGDAEALVTVLVNLLDTDPYLVVEANGVPIIQPMTSIDPMLHIQAFPFDFTNPNPSLEPELSELWYTKKLEMSRGPEPGWDHPWLRSQNRFTSESGVTSTWLTGKARKRFELTFANVFGADRQLLFDLQAQTFDWSEPFWFRPPDTDYATLLVELDRDSLWRQDRDNPFGSGTSDRVTLPLIEVLG